MRICRDSAPPHGQGKGPGCHLDPMDQALPGLPVMRRVKLLGNKRCAWDPALAPKRTPTLSSFECFEHGSLLRRQHSAHRRPNIHHG